MNRVVVILGVGRIDGDERQLAPVLAALQRRGLCRFGLAQRGGRKRLRNLVGVDRDQADRLFASQASRAAPSPCRRQARSRGVRTRSTLTRSPSSAPSRVGFGDVQFAAGLLLVDGNEPPAAVGQGAEDAEHAGLGVIDDLDDAAAIGAGPRCRRPFDAQQRAVADAGRGAGLRAARHMDADFRRGRRFPPRPIRSGVAINSPSLSRPVMSAITVGGSAAGSCSLRPRLAIVPSSASSRRMRFSSTRSAFFRPNSRAISRVPTLPGLRADEGDDGVPGRKAMVALFRFTYPRALPALFFAGAFVGGRFGRGCLGGRGTGARALLTASDFGLAAAFFAAAFLAGFGRGIAVGLRRPWPPWLSWRRAWPCRRPWPRARRSARSPPPA